jgi:transcription termination factor Rho
VSDARTPNLNEVPVSVDSTELQRATLERKDREELATIANALGAKPNSRTKKADLVDMILRASEGANGSANNGTPARAASEPAPASTNGTAVEIAPPPPPMADVPAPAPIGVADAAAPVTSSGDDGPAEAPRRRPRLVGWIGDETGAPTPADVPEEPSLFEDAQAASGTAPSDVETDAGSGSDDTAESAERVEGGEDRRPDFGEPGNRRRRRRGRDRDRGRSGGEERERTERGDRPQGEEVFQGEPVPVAGYLDLRDEGYGFLRINGYLPSRDDAYVSVRQARQFGLRKGDYLTGASRPASRNEKNPALLRIDTVNGFDPEIVRNRPRFEDLTPLFPDEKLRMEHRDDPMNMTARIVDLVSPIGKGQRGLIVSPPKAGKTTVMKQIARSIELNNPEVHLIVLLVDERPEEVTDMRRWLLKGEVAASTFDRPADEHIQVAELTIERAKRMVESGRDVVIILDGITRLARAYNLGAPQTGRIMSGGIDTGALYPPKKFFGAARNVEEGGSLTILATALVETGSRMDEVIFEEFKGTGNMELRLDRKMAERRIYPAIDVDASSTRHEELLFERRQLQQVWKLRRVLSGLASDGDAGAAAGLELLIDRLKTFKSNDEFLAEVAKTA